MQGFLTTQEAAEKLGVTAGRVRQMIVDGQLPATKLGRDNIIKEADLGLVKDRKVGRPPKDKDSSKGKQLRAQKTKRRQRI
jgi:excisionase family DNA binding protein